MIPRMAINCDIACIPDNKRYDRNITIDGLRNIFVLGIILIIS